MCYLIISDTERDGKDSLTVLFLNLIYRENVKKNRVLVIKLALEKPINLFRTHMGITITKIQNKCKTHLESLSYLKDDQNQQFSAQKKVGKN